MAGIALTRHKTTSNKEHDKPSACCNATGRAHKRHCTNSLFRSQGWFHACVDMRAKSIQNLPWAIYSTGSDEPIWSDDDGEVPDNLMFARNLPNLLYKWEASLVTTNRAYSLKENAGRGLSGLPYFSPLSMEPIKSPQGITGFRRTVNSGQIILQS